MPSWVGRHLILAPVLFFLLAQSASAETSVRYFQADSRYSYRTALIALALEKTRQTDGPYSLVPYKSEGEITNTRGALLLKQNQIDLISLATTRDLESNFLPVKIDILKGILGYRVFLIRKDNASVFASVRTFDDLKKYTAGFNSQWADFPILQTNRIPVESVASYDNLFKMLDMKRFDYFPRGMNEAWVELEEKSKVYPSLGVEKSLAIYYPYVVYFFFNKQNAALADRIRRGLEIALKDGSFRSLFLLYHSEIIRRTNLSHRRLFVILNPLLPPGTVEPDTSWWMEKLR